MCIPPMNEPKWGHVLSDSNMLEWVLGARLHRWMSKAMLAWGYGCWGICISCTAQWLLFELLTALIQVFTYGEYSRYPIYWVFAKGNDCFQIVRRCFTPETQLIAVKTLNALEAKNDISMRKCLYLQISSATEFTKNNNISGHYPDPDNQ